MQLNALIPELAVADLGESLDFYRRVLGFSLGYERRAEGFALVILEANQIMLDQIGIGRTWETGPLQRPLGRGFNLQMRVSSIDPLLGRLAAAGVPLFLAPEVRQYRVEGVDVVQRQFCVQDPDGYLLRFCDGG